MKKLLLILMLSLNLSACDRIVDFAFDKLGISDISSTIEQDEKAGELYKALHERNTAQVKALVAANVQQELQAKPEMMEQLYALIPTEPATRMEIQTTSKSITVGDGKITSVSYVYDYPKMKLLFRVVFEGHDGGSQILGFFITQYSMDSADQDNSDQDNGQAFSESDATSTVNEQQVEVVETGPEKIRV